MEVLREYLEKDVSLSECTTLTVNDICDLLDLCFSSTYFVFDGAFYKQQCGCAMGSPVSPIVVNLYMELFEKRALESCEQNCVKKWFRYLDDSFVVLNENKKIEVFKHMNNLDSNIKFTEEICKDDKLAFLKEYVNTRVFVFKYSLLSLTVWWRGRYI